MKEESGDGFGRPRFCYAKNQKENKKIREKHPGNMRIPIDKERKRMIKWIAYM